jgi:polar amino acid transport system substrate-binding protein
MLKRAMVVGALLFAFGGLLAEAQARSLDEIIKSGTVRIGVGANQPPSSSLGPNNQYQGFDQ